MIRILEECPFPIFRIGKKGETLYRNSAVELAEGLYDQKQEKVVQHVTDIALKAFRAKTSQRVDVEAGQEIFNVLFNPVIENGYVNAYGRDVTQIRANEKRLKDTAKFPSENPNPVLRVKSDGEILLANDAARAIDHLIKPGQPEYLDSDLKGTSREAAESGELRQVELSRHGGVFLFTFTPIEGENYINVYGRDITEERHAKQGLVEANAKLEKRVADRTASVRLLQNILLAANSAETFQPA